MWKTKQLGEKRLRSAAPGLGLLVGEKKTRKWTCLESQHWLNLTIASDFAREAGPAEFERLIDG